VLEIGGGSGRSADRRGIERPAPKCERRKRSDAGPQLEAAVRDVLMRHSISSDVRESG
jgi:hypothetical protein